MDDTISYCGCRNMVPMSQNSTVPISDTLPELTQLQRLHLSLNRGQRCVTQAFTFPTAGRSQQWVSLRNVTVDCIELQE